MSADRFARLLVDLSRRVRRLERGVASPQLAASSLEDGYIDQYDDDGNLVGRIGRQEDGSHGYVALDGPTPPTPLAPTVTGGAGGYSVRWRGDFIGGADAYADFQEVEVHAVPVAQGSDFDPDLDPDSTTRVGTITSVIGGSVVVQAPAGTYYVRLVARSRAGKVSDASQAAEVTVTTVVSGEDLADLEQRLDEAEQAIETTIPQAIENAQQAADMALLIAPVSEDAPTQADGEGRPVDAIWTRVDANGDAIGYWRWDGTNWQPLELTQAVIPNLSASKITTGTLSTDRLDANEIAARIATVIQLNADRVVSGTIDTDRLNANEIAARVANVIELNADRITGGTITADLTLQGRLQTSATGQRVVIENDAITQYNADGQFILSTAGGDLVASGEFRSIDSNGMGVIVGNRGEVAAGTSEAGITFPTNVSGTQSPPQIFVSAAASGVLDPSQNLEIQGAVHEGDDYAIQPNVRLKSFDATRRSQGYKNTAAISSQRVTLAAVDDVIINGPTHLQGAQSTLTVDGYVDAQELRQGGVAFERVFEGSAVFTPASGVTLQSAKAVVTPHSVTVHIYLSGVSTTNGTQDVNLGTLHANIPRPTGYFLPWHGWRTGNNFASGLVSHINGSISLRYATASGSGVLIVSASWPY